MQDIEIVELSDQHVLSVRRRGSYSEIPLMIGEICGFAAKRGFVLSGAPIFICHEKSAEEAMSAQAMGNADLEVAFPVTGEARGEEGISFQVLPGGKMAKIVHKGPYDQCHSTYNRIFSWLEETANRIKGPIREVYLNDPANVPTHEILTEIFTPI